ncbi:DUF3597 domain-containing protein [Sphingomonas qomolangmaensis]|uniref:DUF3597 domain-containing protein n=1 Tax=Sphingomonas qomolangmaensis TaxID=2918765 RepID=A0ABY5LA80_9SPHN|nr:DUF3597 domain-containing protein [Sphingomonas qomolangmaensis]UUL83874.1 DUF3597 domain-containing protein [Sphingomonas qomolangmaensis]
MSIFGKIKDAIFGTNGGPTGGGYIGGRKPEPQAAPQAAPAPTAQATRPAPVPAPAQPAPAAPAAAPVAQSAEQRLVELAEFKGNPDLNWRTSIVDLMKLLDLDSSLDNRKELATELGYTGAKDGSAEMNIWLHAAVMKQLGADTAA